MKPQGQGRTQHARRTQGLVRLPFRFFQPGETRVKPYLGVAVGYRVTRALSLEAGFDLTRFEYRGTRSDTTLSSLGATIGF